MKTRLCKAFAITAVLTGSASAEWRTFRSTTGTEVRAEVRGITPEGKIIMKTTSMTVDVAIHQLVPESQQLALVDLRKMIQASSAQPDRTETALDEKDDKSHTETEKGVRAQSGASDEGEEIGPEEALMEADLDLRYHLSGEYGKKYKALIEYARDHKPRDLAQRRIMSNRLENIVHQARIDNWNRVNSEAGSLGAWFRGEEGNQILADFRATADVMNLYRNIISGSRTPQDLLTTIKRDQYHVRVIAEIDRNMKYFAKVPGATKKLAKVREQIEAVRDILPTVPVGE